MATEEVTGWTYAEMLDAKEEFENRDSFVAKRYSFEESYCLREIAFQPEDYDGPQRFCSKYTLVDRTYEERSPQCEFHGGWNDASAKGSRENRLEEDNTRALKHGMYAEDSGLKEEFTEADDKLYETIMGWAEDYGFEEGSPEYSVLEDLALSKVREMRGEVYLHENGEIVTREQFDPTTGEKITEEDTHPLKNDIRLQKKTILDMMKELGLTPKAKSHMDSEQSGANALENITEIANSALDDEDAEYDPEQFD